MTESSISEVTELVPSDTSCVGLLHLLQLRDRRSHVCETTEERIVPETAPLLLCHLPRESVRSPGSVPEADPHTVRLDLAQLRHN